MSLFTTYNKLVERYLADTTETFHTTANKVDAVNEAIQELLEDYDVPEFKKRGTITFDATGVATIPSDYFRMMKLWTVNANGVEENEYKYLLEDRFDAFDSTSAYYWTEDYVVAIAARALKCLPIDSGELQIRFIKLPGTVDSADTIDSGLDSRWDKVVAYGATFKLLDDAGQYDESAAYEQKYNKRVARVYATLKDRGGFKGSSRILSRWERESLLNRN